MTCRRQLGGCIARLQWIYGQQAHLWCCSCATFTESLYCWLCYFTLILARLQQPVECILASPVLTVYCCHFVTFSYWVWASHSFEANMVAVISHRKGAGCDTILDMTVETEV